jgi:hypothetical protein
MKKKVQGNLENRRRHVSVHMTGVHRHGWRENFPKLRKDIKTSN